MVHTTCVGELGDILMKKFMEHIAEVLAPAVGVDAATVLTWLEIPPNHQLGDIALPCFRLAKELRKAPPAIAEELAGVLRGKSGIADATATGAYVNVRLERASALHSVLKDVASDHGYTRSTAGTGQTAAVDLSSPNIAKPFSMGHLRSTVIGTAIANLLESDGYDVLRINHLGDWGTQFGKVIVALHRWGDLETVKGNPIAELNALYMRFHEEVVNEPGLDDEARAAFKRLEDGNEEDLALWRFMVDVSMQEFSRLYAVLGTTFTHNLGESFYGDKMDAVVEELETKGLLTRSEGADVVLLEDIHLPPCLIRRSDGATLYHTRDLAAALYRHNVLGADVLLYVVGGEQRLHFQQLFAVLARMGHTFADKCAHVAFGMMLLDGKKMSTRKGKVVRLEEVLDEAVGRARAIIAEKNPGLSSADEVARAIGVGAVIFNDLKTFRLHDIDFSLDVAVAFEGETGPYVQYTHARACSVLRRAGLLAPGDAPAQGVVPVPNYDGIVDDPTWTLATQISLYPQIRRRAIEEYDPSLIAKHVLDISQAFNHFYHECPILTAEGSLREQRLALTDATRLVIQAALAVLGIAAPPEI